MADSRWQDKVNKDKFFDKPIEYTDLKKGDSVIDRFSGKKGKITKLGYNNTVTVDFGDGDIGDRNKEALFKIDGSKLVKQNAENEQYKNTSIKNDRQKFYTKTEKDMNEVKHNEQIAIGSLEELVKTKKASPKSKVKKASGDKTYYTLIYMQGEEAQPYVDRCNENDDENVIKELIDMADTVGEGNDEGYALPTWGGNDTTWTVKISDTEEYVMAYNDNIPYISLNKVVNSASAGELELLLDSARGIYIPRDFATGFDMDAWHVDPKDAEILAGDPEGEYYWETWDAVLGSAFFEKDGVKYFLYQGESGDLFATPEGFNFDHLASPKVKTKKASEDGRLSEIISNDVYLLGKVYTIMKKSNNVIYELKNLLSSSNINMNGVTDEDIASVIKYLKSGITYQMYESFASRKSKTKKAGGGAGVEFNFNIGGENEIFSGIIGKDEISVLSVDNFELSSYEDMKSVGAVDFPVAGEIIDQIPKDIEAVISAEGVEEKPFFIVLYSDKYMYGSGWVRLNAPDTIELPAYVVIGTRNEPEYELNAKILVTIPDEVKDAYDSLDNNDDSAVESYEGLSEIVEEPKFDSFASVRSIKTLVKKANDDPNVSWDSRELALWAVNEEGLYREILRMARRALDAARFAIDLKSFFTEIGFDKVNMNNVDWEWVASDLLEYLEDDING